MTVDLAEQNYNPLSVDVCTCFRLHIKIALHITVFINEQAIA